MNNIVENILAENSNAVFVFGIDGVLASYGYTPYNHRYPEYIWENILVKGDPYQYARPFKMMQKFIQNHPLNCYICSKILISDERSYKLNFIKKHYDVPLDYVYFVEENICKLNILQDIQNRSGILNPNHIAIIEDNVEVLDYIAEYSTFSTIHITDFFE